jgi:hypothetical protein
MWKRIVLGLAGLAVLAGAAFVFFVIGPRNAWGMLRYDTRVEGSLKVGDKAPDLELVTLEGQRVHLAERLGSKPTVLIFGSFT